LSAAIEYYSYSDYVQWEGNWELIYGYPLMMAPSPMITHQALANLIAFELTQSIYECEACLIVSEQDWKISDDTVVKPDVVMICNEPLGAYITKPPKIVVEVISKSTAKRDEQTKFELYERERVPYYVIIYPNDLKAKVYRLEENYYQKVDDFTHEVMSFDDLECGGVINFEKVFKRFRK
jgi:Uma2 family endonuclease